MESHIRNILVSVTSEKFLFLGIICWEYVENSSGGSRLNWSWVYISSYLLTIIFVFLSYDLSLSRSLANYNGYFASNPRVTIPKTSMLTWRNGAPTIKPTSSSYINYPISISFHRRARASPKQLHHQLLKNISNSPSGSDKTIGRFIIEAKLVQATLHTDSKQRI